MTNNKQQTALQEHITWLKKQLQHCIDGGYSESWIYTYQLVIDNAESMLEIEKERIITAYKVGKIESTIPNQINTTGNEYYNETYGGSVQ